MTPQTKTTIDGFPASIQCRIDLFRTIAPKDRIQKLDAYIGSNPSNRDLLINLEIALQELLKTPSNHSIPF